MIYAMAALLLLSNTSEASMSDRTIMGTVQDQRITGCGVMVTGESMATIRPFIETSLPLAGTVQLSVSKMSASGTSQTNQGWAFTNGALGNTSVQTDVPATLSIAMVVKDEAGTSLCRVQQDLVLDQKDMPA